MEQARRLKELEKEDARRKFGKKGEKVWIVDYLVKYVRPDKEDGKYLPEVSGEEAVWNWMPDR